MKTVIYDQHVAHLAKIVDFAGWEMPLQYSSVIKEHLAVREHVGLFDVSHMGVIRVFGKDAGKLLDYLSTNEILNKHDHTATYTVWASENGGTVDDLIVYREDELHYFLVVNASNRMKSLNHLKKYAEQFDVHIQDRFKEDGILSLQGPKSLSLISPLFLEASHLKKMHFVTLHSHGKKIIVARTGYTGEMGFEIYAPNEVIKELFDWFINEGKIFQLELAGLGARDTLRLEKGYSLYGHELTDDISPNESLSSWTIKWERDFVGKQAMLELEKSGLARHQYGVILEDKGIARMGFEVFKDGLLIGSVTSGNFSPSLNQAIAIVLVNQKLHHGDSIEIKIRNSLVKGHVTALPFLK